ncbi:MAG: hypothetical protein PVF82_03220 [Gammaproteobacteria bacterium]|jgi:hypothetical protein
MKVIDAENTRLILFHKHPVSARMHFLYFRHGGVCAFKPLPKLASIVEKNVVDDVGSVIHPSTISNWGEKQFGLQSGVLQAETEFCERVEVPKGEITVYLAGFKGHTTPDDEVNRYEAKFVTLMECVGIAPVEMLLLQKAYGVIMGGQS